jgi:riboflavin kinase/FMN adenylyltransferase
MFVFGPWPQVPPVASPRQPAAVAVGSYDGVHRGHQVVLRHLREVADDRGLAAGVVTFDEPPNTPRHLTTLDHRLELLEQTRMLDYVWVLPHEGAERPATAEDFVKDVLVGQVGAKAVSVSRQFGLGYEPERDVEVLERLGGELGFDVVALETALTEVEAMSTSGAEVSALLSVGDVAAATERLGRPHEMRGVVELGDQRGRTLGFPTANMAIPDTLVIPCEGVYAGYFIGDDGVARPTAISLGRRPTFYKEGHELLEAHLLDFDGDLYGQHARVQFVEHLRGQQRFGSIDELVAQLHRDIARAREILGAG